MGGSLFGSFSQLNPRKMVRNASMQAAVERARARLKSSGGDAGDDSAAESDADDGEHAADDGDRNSGSDGQGDDHDDSDDGGAASRSRKKAEAAAAAAALQLENRKAQEAEFFDDSFTFSSGGDSFPSLHLSRPLLRAVTAAGYDKPTQIQRMVIPVAMEGRDVCAAARTGSGKTAAFVLPILERLMHRSRRSVASRVLILLPTRELATQVPSAGTCLLQCLIVTLQRSAQKLSRSSANSPTCAAAASSAVCRSASR
jgi:ATP-dependent RNA helicase DDX27